MIFTFGPKALEYLILTELFYDYSTVSRFYIALRTRSLDGLHLSKNIVTRN